MIPGNRSEAENQRLAGLFQFAETFGRSALSRERSPASMRKFVRKLDMASDSAIDSLDTSQVACRKGCWHCCTNMVSAKIPEVLALAAYIRENWDHEQRNELGARLSQYEEASARVPTGQREALLRAPCPLLKDEVCIAYEVRPLACRGMNSADVSACIAVKENPGKAVPVLRNQSQLDTASNLDEGMRQVLQEATLGSYPVELGLALDIALNEPGADERYFAGEPVFETARVQH